MKFGIFVEFAFLSHLAVKGLSMFLSNAYQPEVRPFPL